jgi:hypothetical protein
MSGYHVGRAWTGTMLESQFPCIKAPCGLVVLEEALADCPEHSWQAAKSMRQTHPAYACPGKQ